MNPRTTVIGSGLALAVLLVVGLALRRASRLQRRLFLLFVLLSWVPTLGVISAQWYLARRPMALLESPGLRRSQESSLALAQQILAERLVALQRRAEELVVEGVPPTVGGPAELRAWLEAPGTAGGSLGGVLPGAPERRQVDGRSQLLASAWIDSASGQRLCVAQRLDAGLDSLIAEIGIGSTRVRQVGLFYSQLVRADMLWSLAFVSAIILLLSLLLSRRLADRVGAPIRQLAEATQKVAAGDLETHVEAAALDELDDLVIAFNTMTDELRESKQRLVRSERLAAWQSVARRLAHEIKNPLTPIHLALHRLRKHSDDRETLDSLDTILEETENLRRLADEFSLYARLPEPVLAPTSVGDCARTVVELYRRHPGIEIHWEGWPDDDVVRADEGQLRQLLANLVKNAFEAMGESGVLVLKGSGDADFLCVQVLDDGPGIKSDPEKLFAADFTTKSSGSGLGLAIARKIAEDHGGSLHAENRREGGACFTLRLRRAASESRDS
jgi:signal transduction histidine kinase